MADDRHDLEKCASMVDKERDARADNQLGRNYNKQHHDTGGIMEAYAENAVGRFVEPRKHDLEAVYREYFQAPATTDNGEAFKQVSAYDLSIASYTCNSTAAYGATTYPKS